MHPISPDTTVESLNEAEAGQAEQSYITCVADAGVSEVFTCVALAFANTSQGDYLAFTEPVTGEKFAAWMDKDADGTVPTGAVYVAADRKVKVSITTGMTASQVGQALKSALEGDGHFDGFTISGTGATLTFTAIKHGTATDAATHNTGDTGAGSLVAAVATQGVAATLQNKYVTLHTGADAAFYAWFNVDGLGVDPAPGGTGIEVALSTTGGAGAEAVATALATAIDNNSNFAASADGSRVKVVNSAQGASTEVTAGNSGFTVATQLEGSAQDTPGPADATGSLTNF